MGYLDLGRLNGARKTGMALVEHGSGSRADLLTHEKEGGQPGFYEALIMSSVPVVNSARKPSHQAAPRCVWQAMMAGLTCSEDSAGMG